MDFPMTIGDEAKSVAPEIGKGNARVQLTDTELCVQFGQLLSLGVERTAVSGAVLLPDPRPSVFLPPGVSAAAEQLGKDVLCAVGSYDGLVRIDFSHPVEAGTRPSDLTLDDEPASPISSVKLQHLIVSLADPQKFVDAVHDGLRASAGSTA